MSRPRLTDDQLAEWEKYALADEEAGEHFLAPPGALLVLIYEVQEARASAGKRSFCDGAP